MPHTVPACPQCGQENTYPDADQFICPDCGSAHDIFGHGGAVDAARERGLDVLGQIPLDPAIMRQAEEGVPIVIAAPDSGAADAYSSIAEQVAGKLSL